MIIQNALVFREDDCFARGSIETTGEWISGLGTQGGAPGADVIDAEGCYAIPGLIDIHLHGCVRHDFSTGTPEEFALMAEYQARNGVTAICPTTMTLPEEVLATACGNVAVSGGSRGAALVGIHLEGPFVSREKIGAQNPAYLTPPDIELVRRLQEAARGMVRILSIAPELEGAMELIGQLGGELCVSLAHTSADYDTALKAFAQGARQITHMYNAMPPFSHRAPGVIGAALDTPDCRVELICDNVHVHPSVVRASFAMFGDDRILFISDSMMATGLGDGEYLLGGLAVNVQGNTARLAEGGAIAGSVTNLMDCVRTAVKVVGLPLQTAVKCASVNPARQLGIHDTHGGLEAGKYANIVLLNPDLSLRQVILRGRPLIK